MTTTSTPIDRSAINRRNAQKSTGPRTPEGKNRSRFNAVKHGMTAKTLVLLDEDADVLQMRVETWIADLQPQNDVEHYLVEQAVHLSWRLDRAERAEVARLSHIIRSVPIAEANRQQEVVAALGYWLLSDRHVAGNTDLRTDLLNVLVPAQESRTDCRHLDIRDHPEAIVFRLESTAVGCQWLLDRWTELRAVLDQGAPWLWDEKVKALRLLGKRPLDMDPQKWQGYIEDRDEVDDLKLEDLIEEQLDRQLDQRLAAKNPATLAVLRSIADQAIARLETLAAGHRKRAEADAAQQAALLSFDASNEGERLRRYQFSCSRSLFRSLDTLIKVRRTGLGVACGDRNQGSEEDLPFPVESESVVPTQDGNLPAQGDDPTPVVSPEIHCEAQAIGNFTMETAETKTERRIQGRPEFDPVVEAAGIDETMTETDPMSATRDRGNRQNEPKAPSLDHGNRQNEPKAPQVAAIPRPGFSFHRAVIVAMTLVVLSGPAVRSHRHSQNEPTAGTVDPRNRQNEPTAAPRRVALDDADAVGMPPEMPRRPEGADRSWSRGFQGERGSVPAGTGRKRLRPNLAPQKGSISPAGGPNRSLTHLTNSDSSLALMIEAIIWLSPRIPTIAGDDSGLGAALRSLVIRHNLWKIRDIRPIGGLGAAGRRDSPRSLASGRGSCPWVWLYLHSATVRDPSRDHPTVSTSPDRRLSYNSIKSPASYGDPSNGGLSMKIGAPLRRDRAGVAFRISSTRKRIAPFCHMSRSLPGMCT
jgi:hypothetical protein